MITSDFKPAPLAHLNIRLNASLPRRRPRPKLPPLHLGRNRHADQAPASHTTQSPAPSHLSKIRSKKDTTDTYHAHYTSKDFGHENYADIGARNPSADSHTPSLSASMPASADVCGPPGRAKPSAYVYEDSEHHNDSETESDSKDDEAGAGEVDSLLQWAEDLDLDKLDGGDDLLFNMSI